MSRAELISSTRCMEVKYVDMIRDERLDFPSEHGQMGEGDTPIRNT